jgi:hypothetical protein
MPDNTLHGMLEVSGEDTIGGFLARLTRTWHRAKKLEPVHGQRIAGEVPHVLVYDGKQSVASEVEQPAPYFKKSTSKTSVVDGKKVKEKVTYWAADFVRCVLGSAAAGVCIGLGTVVNSDEVGAVKDLHARMLDEHRWLRTDAVLVLADAKHGNKDFIKQLGDPYPEPRQQGRRPGTQYYLLKIKGNAGAIFKEGLAAIRRKANVEPPEAVTDFENAGHGRRTRRELYRVETNLAYGADQDEAWRLSNAEDLAVLSKKDWPTVRQIVCVKETTIHKQPVRSCNRRRNDKNRKNVRRRTSKQERTTVTWRLAVTNVKREDVTPIALLRFFRMEWAVEVHHNLLDLVMREDDQPWARLRQAPIAMAGLNSIAANLLAMLKLRYLRAEASHTTLSYPQLVSLIFMVMTAGKVARILQANGTAKSIQVGGPTPSTEEVDPEFAKQWSDADLSQILAAIQILFGLALRLLSHLHKVNLTVSADSGCSAISMVLQTE